MPIKGSTKTSFKEEIDVDDLFKWISSLKRLASLNLTGVQSLETVPPSIRKLRNLQLLVLSGCSKLKRLNQSIITLRKLIVLDIGFSPLEFLPRGFDKLCYLQELTGFKVTNQSKKNCCQFQELRGLSQLRVLRMSISDETEILESEMNILCELKELKILSIDAENCRRNNKEILGMIDRLAPPPSLQELYLRNYHRESLPIWVNPGTLSELQYLCVENSDIHNLSLETEDKNCDLPWNIEGLCLKFLTRIDMEWNELQNNMPLLRHLEEISHCYKLKNFPCSVKSPRFWSKK
ncbi:hypothetical protein F8388_021369 [Cannabis sativa]|uniref:Disease resistance R13L4/SHOC-2-like LRR domain-containing protein n=1 Tax=Cannabis sativa TaxID=3483 RepID=A0A7J6FDJ2_CANSA|nr:hypothetical protein F8388_021369 [Cannabis sativa]